MDNYKVKVKNKAESKEVQGLFEQLDYKLDDFDDYKYPQYLACYEDGTFSNYVLNAFLDLWKELTIQQLKDLVVLKRNDVGDATHACDTFHKRKGYLTSDGVEYGWNYTGGYWCTYDSNLNFKSLNLNPIKEKEMKEYLRINNDGKYILEVTNEREAKEPHAKHWIEVPKGFDYLISNLGVNSFIDSDMFAKVKPKNILWSRKEMKEFLVNHDNKWTLQLLDSDTKENSYRVAVPSGANICIDEYYFYIDYNTALTDQGWMDCEKAGLKTVELMVKTGGRIIWQRSETESLNDQYAEIEQVRQETVKVTIDELKHRVYKKDISHLDSIDVYRVLELFNVQSHAVGHAIKKLLCSGGRGAKDEAQDIQEAIDSLVRYQEMEKEDYVLFDS